MTAEEIKTIGAIADMCRTKGVRVLDLPNIIHMELDQTQPTATARPTNDPDLCRCGHMEHAHMNGLCVMGCDAEKCAEQDKQ